MTLDRRALLRFGVAAPLLPAALLEGVSAAIAQETAEQPETVSTLAKPDWIDKALSLPPSRGFAGGTLQMARFRDPIYYLTAPISWQPGPDDPAGLPNISVPKGFVTDLASIPRPFFSFLRPDGDYVYAAVLHDYLYWQQTTSRAVADTVLKVAMQDFEVPALTVTAIYQGVHLGGGAAWKNNRQLRNRGEKRVLRQVPNDPLVTWADWKRKPGVF